MRVPFLLIPILVISIDLLGQQTVTKVTPEPQYNLVNKFESHGETALQALLRLGTETRTPLGLVQNGRRLCESKTDISIAGESVGSIVDRLASPIGYAWSVENGVVVIKPRTPSISTLQLLNTSIPRFAAPRTTLEGLGVFLAIDVRAVFHPERGSAGSLSRSPDATLVGPLEINNITVEQALNVIVTQATSGGWILHPVPDDYRNAADSKFIDIIDYGLNPMPTIQNLTCAP
jgi:hypothetical protein